MSISINPVEFIRFNFSSNINIPIKKIAINERPVKGNATDKGSLFREIKYNIEARKALAIPAIKVNENIDCNKKLYILSKLNSLIIKLVAVFFIKV